MVQELRIRPRLIEHRARRRYNPGIFFQVAALTAGAETVVYMKKFKAKTIGLRDFIRIKTNISPGATGVNTSRVRFRFGGLTGQVLFDTTAIDLTTDDEWIFDCRIYVRSATELVAVTRWTRTTAASGAVVATLMNKVLISTGVDFSIDNDVGYTLINSNGGDIATRGGFLTEHVRSRKPHPS